MNSKYIQQNTLQMNIFSSRACGGFCVDFLQCNSLHWIGFVCKIFSFMSNSICIFWSNILMSFKQFIGMSNEFTIQR